MNRFIGYSICVVIFGGTFIASVSGAFDGGGKSGLQTIVHSEGYKNAVKRTVEHKAEDELNQVFHTASTLDITGKGISHLTTILPLQNGLLAHDWMKRQILHFDGDGVLKGPFGKKGATKGAFLTPSSISQSTLDDQGIWVTDFSLSRVSRLALDGSYLGSFSSGEQRFSAKGLVQSPSTGQIAVCGNSVNRGRVESLHSYSADGVSLGSLYALPDDLVRLGVDSANDCLFTRSSHDAYVAFSYDYTVFRIDKEALKLVLSSKVPHFRPPSTALKLDSKDPEESMRRFDDWALKATLINAVGVTGDTTLLVQYETYDPLHYRLDVWDLPGNTLRASIRTNHRLLATSGETAYFLDQMESSDQNQYSILQGKIVK